MWKREDHVEIGDGEEVFGSFREPLLTGVPVIPRGNKMGGQFFPLLFDPEAH